MVIRKRNTPNGIKSLSLNRPPPLKGLQAFPPKRIPEATPGSSGVDDGGKLFYRFILNRGVFPEIFEGHCGRT